MGGKRGFENILRKEAMNKKTFRNNDNAKDKEGRYVKDIREE